MVFRSRCSGKSKGNPWSQITSLGMSDFLSHDLCHRQNSSRWLLAGFHTFRPVVSRFSGWPLSQCRGIRCISVDWDIGVFWNGGRTPGVPLDFQVETVCSWDVMGKPSFLSRRSREMDPQLKMRRQKQDSSWVVAGPWCSSRVEMVMLGNFLSCIKDVKDTFKPQEGRWDFSWDSEAEKSFISCWGEKLLFFLQLWNYPRCSSRVTSGKSGTRSCCPRKVQSPCEFQGAFRNSSPVDAGC